MTHKKVGIWVRLASVVQEEENVLTSQKTQAIEFATSQGWEITKAYLLEGLSGRTIMNHPQTQQMLNDIKNNVINGLVFLNNNSLLRSTNEYLKISKIFQGNNADLISMQTLQKKK